MTKLVTRIFPILAVFCLLLSSVLHADSTPYMAKKRVEFRRDHLVVVHEHDWGHAAVSAMWELYISRPQRDLYFTEKNQVSFLQLVNEETGKTLFRKPVPALTHVWISPDAKYVVGLSQIKLYNPWQFVVFDAAGNLLHCRYIGQMAVLTKVEWDEFQRKYTNAGMALAKLLQAHDGKVYIDVRLAGHREAMADDALAVLRAKMGPPPCCTYVGESVTNFVLWFLGTDPEIKVEKDTPEALVMSLLDPVKHRFTLTIPRKP